MTSTFQESIYKSRKTLLDYLNDMGYNTNSYKDYNYDSIYNMIINNSLDMYFEDTINIYCKFHVQKNQLEHNILKNI